MHCGRATGSDRAAWILRRVPANPTCTDQIMADLPKDRVIKIIHSMCQVLKQIALDDKDNPNLSRVLQEDIYMDDLLSGEQILPNNAISICKDIAHVLSTRGFHLRNGISNSTEFLAQFSNIVLMMHELNFLSKDSNESSKVSKAFNAINYLTVPRWVILTADNIVELHGFADASSLAYAAAIYCRQKHNGKIKVQLLVSKTKSSPVKQVSIPRLSFLSWLSGHPRKWKTFCKANRTSENYRSSTYKALRHVPSKENPADIASRGDVLLSVPERTFPSSSNHREIVGSATEHQTGLWKKWSSEFISSLQPRKKWQDAQPNLKEDDIVLDQRGGSSWYMANGSSSFKCIQATTDWFVLQPETQDSVFKRPVHINFTNLCHIRTSSDIGWGVCFLTPSFNRN
ncbi:uncharacterized protein TNCV_3277861 [Trichonephila clavipes]|nr:uncharacterized protein TNCV_3277861 [Trichonephila clavipes]